MEEDEKKRRVIVSYVEDLRRAVHLEQTNESVWFVGGVELQSISYCYLSTQRNVHHSCRGGDDATKMCARHDLGLQNEMHGSWW